MSLRYKGVPVRGANIQADKMPDLCFCSFVAVGEPLNDSKCSVHAGVYRCGGLVGYYEKSPCQCPNYRPRMEKKSPSHWPLCVCGHTAQDH